MEQFLLDVVIVCLIVLGVFAVWGLILFFLKVFGVID